MASLTIDNHGKYREWARMGGGDYHFFCLGSEQFGFVAYSWARLSMSCVSGRPSLCHWHFWQHTILVRCLLCLSHGMIERLSVLSTWRLINPSSVKSQDLLAHRQVCHWPACHCLRIWGDRNPTRCISSSCPSPLYVGVFACVGNRAYVNTTITWTHVFIRAYSSGLTCRRRWGMQIREECMTQHYLQQCGKPDSSTVYS